jgi:hypothetical protein
VRRAIGLALVSGAAVALSAGPAWAATLTVQNTTDDAGTTPCTSQNVTTYGCPTLRDAVAYAGAGSAGASPTIELGPHIYTLAGELDVTGPMTISGTGPSGAGASVIEQSSAGARVLSVPSAGSSLTLVDLRVTGGRLQSSNGTGVEPCDPTSGQAFGGGICSEAPLTLIDVAVNDNHTTGAEGNGTNADGDPAVGGAIYATETLSLANSTVSGNSSMGGAGVPGTATQAGGFGGTGGSAVTASTVTIAGSSITDNVSTGGLGGAGSTTAQHDAPGNGGDTTGALSAASATITNATIGGNAAVAGAGGDAIESDAEGGTGGEGDGGGVFVIGSASISNSTISDNSVTGGAGGSGAGPTGLGGTAGAAGGGGITISKEPSSIASSTIDGNAATTGARGTSPGGTGYEGDGADARGGGIVDGLLSDPTQEPGTELTLTGSTIAANKAIAAGNLAGAAGTSNAFGGGVQGAAGATVTIVNSTAFGNQVVTPTTGDADGGGVDGEGTGTSITLASDTLDGNGASAAIAADAFGGSINSGTGAAVAIAESIVTGAGAPGTRNCETDGGTLTDGGHNLEDDSAATCGFSAADHDLVGSNPGLPPALGSNGGPTQTLAPAPGSPVIRAGGSCADPTLSPSGPLATDQRGDPRVTSCDIGAVQTEPVALKGDPSVTGHAVTGSVLTCAQGSLSVSGDGVRSSAGAIGAPAITYAWLRNGEVIRGTTASSFRIPEADVHAHLSCTVSITGAYGHGSATSLAIKVAALAPVISKLSQTNRKWRETGRRHGTTFTFTLNEGARVTLTFTRGRHSSGTLTVNGRSGRNRLRFAGLLKRHKRLRSGGYRVSFRARADGLRSRVKSLTFTIRG